MGNVPIISTALLGWIGIGGYIFVGIFAVIGLLDKVKKERQEMGNRVDDRLINLLKNQVEALEKKVDILEKSSQINNHKIEKLENRNEVLEEIFQGRDAQTQEFQKRGFEAMEQSALVVKNIADIEERVNKILDIIVHREVVVTKIHKDMQEALDANKEDSKT